jgi:hypothetical protein
MIQRRQVGGGRMAERDGLAAGAELVNGIHDPAPGLSQKSCRSRATAAARSPWTPLKLLQKVVHFMR